MLAARSSRLTFSNTCYRLLPQNPPFWSDVDPGQLVLYSIYVYVPIFLVLVIIHTLLRSKYPNLFNPKNEREYPGMLAWIPRAYSWSEKDILDKV